MPAVITMSAISAFSASTRKARSSIRSRSAAKRARAPRSARCLDHRFMHRKCPGSLPEFSMSMCSGAMTARPSSKPSVAWVWNPSRTVSMPKLLKARNFAIDAWQRFDGDAARIAGGDALLFHLPVWLAQRDTLLARDASRTGIWLNGDEEPEQIAADIHRFGCIAVNFPTFMDGRSFSCGRLLREQYGFHGELRAIGDIFVDQLHFLR